MDKDVDTERGGQARRGKRKGKGKEKKRKDRQIARTEISRER